MAELSERHPRLNLLNLEAAACARAIGATLLLSRQGSAGVLPEVLDAEGIPWGVVDLV